MHDSVTVHMSAPADRVWGIISDITTIGEWSTEVFEQEWLGRATGPALGAKFRGHVKRKGTGLVYWTTCKVTACEPGKSFGFAVLGPKESVINTWLYEIAESGDGVDVTESFALKPTLGTRLFWLVAGSRRTKTNVEGMRATLEGIKAAAEKPSSPGAG